MKYCWFWKVSDFFSLVVDEYLILIIGGSDVEIVNVVSCVDRKYIGCIGIIIIGNNFFYLIFVNKYDFWSRGLL